LDHRALELLRHRYEGKMPFKELARRFKRPADQLAVTLHRLRRALMRCMTQASP
jgi:hypothetical protein